MPNKIKLFFGFLALIAMFSVYSVFNSLGGKSASVAVIGSENPLAAPDTDADHDGLTNKEESYWNTDPFNPDTDGDGFKDGEEVASGHDPLKPGPDDLLANSANLTEKVQNLVVGGLYSQDLKPDNKNFDLSIGNISAVIIDDFYKSQTSKNPQLVLVDSSKENQESYLKNTIQIIKQVLLSPPPDIGLIKNSDADQNIAIIVEYLNNFKSAYQGLVQMPVPKNWKEIHSNLLDIIDRSIFDYESLGSYQSDPYKAYIAVSDMDNIESDTKDFMKKVNLNINQNHLILDDSLFKLLNQLYK